MITITISIHNAIKIVIILVMLNALVYKYGFNAGYNNNEKTSG